MSQALLTLNDVASWRNRLVEITKEERRLMDERAQIQRKLEAVIVLFGEIPEEDSPEPNQQVASPPAPATRSGRTTWPTEIVKVFEREMGPLTYDQLKDAIDKGELKGEYEKSAKGFYHAVARLQQKRYLTKHNGWLFRTGDLEVHLKQVASGEVTDVDDVSGAQDRPSPMAEEIKAFLASRPAGVLSSEVLANLKKDDRFFETLTRNPTGAYNVISRLEKRGEIRKEGKRLYPLKENEPPKGGSETEGVAAPSFF